MLKKLIFILLSFVFTDSFAQINIDLINGTINGKQILEYPLDSLTDLLGRPTYVDDGIVAAIIGTGIKYHHLGLEFRVEDESKDPAQGVKRLYIYLSKTLDEDASEFFTFNNVSIVPEVNRNFKAKQIENLFADNISTILTAEQADEDRKKNFGENSSPPEGGYGYTIFCYLNNHAVAFVHEDVTKFLEKIAIQSEFRF